jgi:hypothetical protein
MWGASESPAPGADRGAGRVRAPAAGRPRRPRRRAAHAYPGAGQLPPRGATTTLTLPLALSAWQLRQTSREVVAASIRSSITTDAQIAVLLNERGYQSGTGKAFHAMTVYRIRHEYQLRSRYERLRAAGMLDMEEMATRLGVAPYTVKVWRRAGLLCTRSQGDLPASSAVARFTRPSRRCPSDRGSRYSTTSADYFTGSVGRSAARQASRPPRSAYAFVNPSC